ncbi:MAG: four helix bundle protein [Dehalococcoidia bacterium]|nr:four helix bundle protein [Dehalococcoidia bacterium]
MNDPVRSCKDLDVYRRAMNVAMEIFQLTKTWPAEERYSMVDQVRRSSRSVCANIGEAWRKRRYPAAFIAKLSDAEGEAGETLVWLEFAQKCGYLPPPAAAHLEDEVDHILAQLVRMIDQPAKWTPAR